MGYHSFHYLVWFQNNSSKRFAKNCLYGITFQPVLDRNLKITIIQIFANGLFSFLDRAQNLVFSEHTVSENECLTPSK